MPSSLLPLVFVTAALSSPALLGSPLPDFNREIRPILSDKCFRCHGPDENERKGGQDGLRLDTAAGATEDLGGGGYAIVPGKPDESELLDRVTHPDEDEIMPPPDAGRALTPQQVDLLRRWIAGGASYAQHWAYEKPRRTTPPDVKDTSWPKGAIDRFILAQLEPAGLRPQPAADRAAIGRRVALDLTGLPPELGELESFVQDRDPQAYERFVDRQLAKPAYGEHWARGWLDLARYADSKGYADDQPRSIWRYRDYVIDAFNRNMPFDQFTVEQLAGDLLPDATKEQLFATGFHRNTMNNTEGGTDNEEFRSAAVIDRVNTTMAVWMGTSIACAQCHTHKYDPLTHKEYFQLYAIFNQTEDADRTDEAPVLEFYTGPQKAQRAASEAEIAALVDRMIAAKHDHVAAAKTWAEQFPATIEWSFLRPLALHAESGTELKTFDDGSIFAAPGQETDTYTIEVPMPEGVPITALRLDSLPHADLPGEGAGGGPKGNFVVTRVRAGVKPAEPFHRGRYIRVELPGKKRVLALAEVQIFSRGENIASRGTASQSSTAEQAAANAAIDGRTEGDPEMQSISRTETGEAPWWEIDLQSMQPLERVEIWGQTGLDPTPRGLRIVVFDEQKRIVWEQTAPEAPSPSRTFDISDPREITLRNVVTDFAQPTLDESLVTTGRQPKTPNRRKRTATQTGWGVKGATTQPHTLTVEPDSPITLAPGEKLVLTIEQQSKKAKATLNHFRVGATTDPGAGEHLRTPLAELAVLRTPAERRDTQQHDLLLEYYVRHIAPDFESEQRRMAVLQKSLDDMPIQTSPIMRELPEHQQRKTHIQLRGSFMALGEEVTGGVPAVFPPLPEGEPVNRLTLARWLVDDNNPLTARVQANRLWESIFGIGLVRTTEEFGSQGEPPTHPELLDWLAVELVEGRCDIKRFLKTLVMSAAYRQSSRVTAEALEIDPENRLISRGPRFRMAAEMVRDQALAVSGLLSSRSHGPSSRPYQPEFGLRAAFGSDLDWQTSTGEDRLRRGLYTEWRRSSPYPSMVTFDAPSREVCTLRRNRSNTPLQALVTLNDPVYVEAAQALARMIAGGSGTTQDKAREGFRRVLLRLPTDAEAEHLVSLYNSTFETFSRSSERAHALIANPENPPPSAYDPAELAAWTTVANVLLNLDEALMKR